VKRGRPSDPGAGALRGVRRLAGLALLPLLASCAYWTPRSAKPGPAAVSISTVPMQKWDIRSCGAGALSSVLQHYGDETTMQQWDDALPKTRGGVMSIDLVLAARKRGFDASIVNGDAGLLQAEVLAGRPVIAMLRVIQAPGRSYDFFHYIVIDGYDAQRDLFRTQFGDGRARWVKLSRLESAWGPTSHATIVIRPPDPAAEAIRAAVRLEQGEQYALAAHAYREILQTHPTALVWTNLGNVEVRMQDTAAAEKAFREAIRLEPSAADALNNLAWLLHTSGRDDEAESMARRAVAAAGPDRWTRLDTLARILAGKGECTEARTLFRSALAELPPSAPERSDLELAARDCGTPRSAAKQDR
jgi:Flp pilus assembly protein TadD